MSATTPALRILHTEASLGWGGQEIRILTEARGLARLGHDVTLAAPAEARITSEAARFGVKAMAAPIGRKRPRALKTMRALLADGRFDVVNTHSSTDSWLAALACALLRDPPPLVRTRHISSPVPRNLATRWLYARASHRIVTTGEALRSQVMAEAGVAPDRVVSIPTGIDLERFRPADRAAARAALGLPLEGPILGIVATLRSWKGHEHLLHAAAAMQARPWTLVVVGDGPRRAALEALANRLGLAVRVRFCGNQADVSPWLQSLDVFCLPSYANEGVPQALMQAMACALPVVSTPVGSIPEIVVDGDTGLIVPAQDPARLRAALESLLDDGAMRERLGARARAFALERFDERLMVERMAAVFRDAAATRHG
jgi:glycosyltransferase involved in cell wall biosynthesis